MKSIRFSVKYVFSATAFLVALLGVLFLAGCGHSGDKDQVPQRDKTVFTVSYIASDGGMIKSTGTLYGEKRKIQSVRYGEEAEEVTAVPDAGYYFVRWSDGAEDATRRDRNVTEDISFTAEFAEITDSISLTYKAKGPGRIYGNSEQVVQRGTDAWTVKAEPYSDIPGKVFVRWSDGLTAHIRQDKHVTEDKEVTAEFGFTVTYKASENGSIVGTTEQIIISGQTAESVTALPDKGYRFVEWSDGVKTATRQDKWVSDVIDVYAVFEWRDTDTFQYHYNYATGNYYEDGLTLTRGEVAGKSATVPTRDHFTFDGWYLDEDFQTRAFDSDGNNLLEEEIFDSPSRDLYAKWIVEEKDVVTYKILMVYVTAIDGTFVGNDGKSVSVHYRMDGELKRQCLEMTRLFSETLNDMLDGLVIFDIDNYFTTQSINEQCFTNEKNSTRIYAYQIPELNESGVLDNYRSVLTVYSFGGEANLLTDWAGVGDEKYASIPLDESIRHHASLEQAFEDYNAIIGTCVHEFIHTIEMNIVSYEFHRAYNPGVPTQILNKLYLLNQFPTDFYNKLGDKTKLSEEELKEAWRNSEKAGVPYGYWTNEIFDVVVKPECINGASDADTGGSVRFYYSSDTEEHDWWRNYGNSTVPYGQRVPQGSRTTVLIPVAKAGYRFIGWSDGVQEEERILIDIQGDVTLIACFERLSYTVEYIAGEGGRIEGDLVQTLLTGDKTTWVTAIPDEGYRFVGWSATGGFYNSPTKETRRDIIGSNEYDENGELYFRLGFSVTAIFEKID